MNESSHRTVLVVGPSPQSRATAVASMELAGHRCIEAATGTAAVEALAGHLDLVLLDARLPDLPGFAVLEAIRRSSGSIPIIVVPDETNEDQMLRALRLGADDYLPAPFSPRELIARVDAAIRRAERSFGPDGEIRHGDLRIDLASRDVQIRGAGVELTAKEFDLLAFLASAPGIVFTRSQLLRAVWGSSPDWQGAATVTEHIRRLRKLIERNPKDPSFLRTVRSVGYRFDLPDQVQAA